MIRRHPAWGDQLAGELGFDASTRRLIRSHHELLDGSGYPDGLSGGQLDADVRILTVCDVYDALVSERVYRPAYDVGEAMSIMWDDAGRSLDPGCLRALAAVLGVEAARPPLPDTQRPAPPGQAASGADDGQIGTWPPWR